MSTQTRPTARPQASEIISYDPATGEEIGRVPFASLPDVTLAVRRARAAQPAWAALTFRERGRFIMDARQIVLDEMEQIATLISRETGKPVAEAISMEIVTTLDLMQFFARQTARLLRPQKIDIGQYGLMGRSSRLIYKPLGVIGIISPWNFPWATPLDEIVMALLAGNAAVVKPSELTPLTAMKIAEIFQRAGLPDGLLAVITGDGSTGAALVDAGVNKIIFTGSVATGKRVAQTAAETLTPVVLELGGKDPMIVLEDADLENAARGAIWGAFANAGQCCASVERCYVHESIAPRFVELVVKETERLKLNSGLREDTDIGAMSSEPQLRIVEDHVKDAVNRGARILTGGRRAPQLSGLFYPPTVLTEVDHRMAVMREETSDPLALLLAPGS